MNLDHDNLIHIGLPHAEYHIFPVLLAEDQYYSTALCRDFEEAANLNLGARSRCYTISDQTGLS